MILTKILNKIQIRHTTTCCSNAEHLLSSENKRRCIRKFTAIKTTRKLPEQKRLAAVLIPMCYVENELALLYTLRSTDLKTHRGQVSFPGGRRDKTDSSFTETALRETEEELGIPRSEIEIWCEGHPLPAMPPNVVIPVIGLIKNSQAIQNIVKNPSEVADVFTITLANLCKLENCRYTQFKKRGFSSPVFVGGPRRIWGLTAVLTYFLLKCLMPKGVYNHEVPYFPPLEKGDKKNL